MQDKKALEQEHLRNRQRLEQLDRERRDAVTIYRPIKKQYVAKYRTTCIQRRQRITEIHECLDFLKNIFEVTDMQVSSINDDRQSLPALDSNSDAETSQLALKKSSSADSIRKDFNKAPISILQSAPADTKSKQGCMGSILQAGKTMMLNPINEALS